ncbi:MAG: hypothetical protein R3C05_31245 [Pirellulaceae bacterium]
MIGDPIRWGFIALLVFAPSFLSMRANAAVIYDLNDKAIGAWIVREEADTIIFDEALPGGGKQRRQMDRGEILRVLHSVSPERLEKLRPEDPKGYKQYAEELAEIQIDPEARPMAMRLYHIAAYLDPQTLAESCLLAMARIADNEAERRRLLFAAYLFGKSGERRILSSAERLSAGNVPEKIDHSLNILERLRTRQTYKFDAEDLAVLRGLLPTYTAPLTDNELLDQIDARCPDCRSGYVRCEHCSGRGTTGAGARRRQCRYCTRGKIPCKTCGTYFREQALPEAFAREIVGAELALRRQRVEPQAASGAKQSDSDIAWSATFRQSPDHFIPPLTLLGLTEHDPTQCLYKSGQWVRSEE